MEAVEIKKEQGRYTFSIDESQMDKLSLEKIVNRIWIQYLVEKAQFDKSILELGREMKADWWQKNKTEILKKINEKTDS